MRCAAGRGWLPAWEGGGVVGGRLGAELGQAACQPVHGAHTRLLACPPPPQPCSPVLASQPLPSHALLASPPTPPPPTRSSRARATSASTTASSRPAPPTWAGCAQVPGASTGGTLNSSKHAQCPHSCGAAHQLPEASAPDAQPSVPVPRRLPTGPTPSCPFSRHNLLPPCSGGEELRRPWRGVPGGGGQLPARPAGGGAGGGVPRRGVPRTGDAGVCVWEGGALWAQWRLGSAACSCPARARCAAWAGTQLRSRVWQFRRLRPVTLAAKLCPAGGRPPCRPAAGGCLPGRRGHALQGRAGGGGQGARVPAPALGHAQARGEEGREGKGGGGACWRPPVAAAAARRGPWPACSGRFLALHDCTVYTRSQSSCSVSVTSHPDTQWPGKPGEQGCTWPCCALSLRKPCLPGCSAGCRAQEQKLGILQARDVRLRPRLRSACSEELSVFCKDVEPGGGWGKG